MCGKMIFLGEMKRVDLCDSSVKRRRMVGELRNMVGCGNLLARCALMSIIVA